MFIDSCIELPDDFVRKFHSKASEEYIAVKFIYGARVWEGWVPVEYRRTGISIKDECQIREYFKSLYNEMRPENHAKWLTQQNEFWRTEKPHAGITKSFFDVLSGGKWCCVACQLPANSNPTRRIQDLKEFGYTLATDKKRFCPHCRRNRTHFLLLPVKRCQIVGNGYETWSPALRRRIIHLLGGRDVLTGSVHCLPDHKFPEIRWDSETKTTNPDSMSDGEIREKFQLLTNQHNQQKRETCRKCFHTGQRGTILGIEFFYRGTGHWDDAIPKKGKNAEAGCIGCPWYDFPAWRKALQEKVMPR